MEISPASPRQGRRSSSPSGGPTGPTVSISMPVEFTEQAAAKTRQKRSRSNREQDKWLCPTWFIWLMEWAGNALGAISFLWATVVLLGGFCSYLEQTDFWAATSILFIEAFRLFNEDNKLASTSLFDTTRAIRRMRFPLAHMLQQRHEFYGIMVITCFFINMINYIPYGEFVGMAVLVLIILLTKLNIPVFKYLQHCQEELLGGLLIGVLIPSGLVTYTLWKNNVEGYLDVLTFVSVLPQIGAVLVLNLRPQIIIKVTKRTCVRILLHLAKIVLVICLIGDIWIGHIHVKDVFGYLAMPLSMLVPSIGSVQGPQDGPIVLLIDAGFLICVIVNCISTWLFLSFVEAFFALLMVSVTGNLQIPASIIRVWVSVERLHGQHDAYQNPESPILLVPAINIFNYMVLLQGVLYLAACTSEAVSIFLRRSLAPPCGLRGQQEVEFLEMYHDYVYKAYMEGRFVLEKLDLATFVIESLESKSCEMQLVCLRALDSFVLQQETQIISRLITSKKTVTKLISLLEWTDTEHDDIRLFSARIIAELAPRLRISRVSGAIKILSSLLVLDSQALDGRSENKNNKNDIFPVLGLLILERLPYTYEDFAEILGNTDLIPKIVMFISYSAYKSTDNICQRRLIISSLNIVKAFANTGGKIGALLRKELSENIFLLDNISKVLDDSRSGPEVWEPAFDLITILSMDLATRKEIGRIRLVMAKLVHAFLGKDESLNRYYNYSLRKVAGEALAMLTMENAHSCLMLLTYRPDSILQDLIDMLHEADFRVISGTILLHLTALSRSELYHQGSHEQISSPIPLVMESLMKAGGKELEVLIGLASQLPNVIPICFAKYMESFRGADLFIQKLVDELYANKRPNSVCPRMRRVIVELTISILEACPHYAIMFKEQGMMEALNNVEENPSRVEKCIIFIGDEGTVWDRSIDDLSTLVARAKKIIGTSRPTDKPVYNE